MEQLLQLLTDTSYRLIECLTEKATLDTGILQAELEAFHSCEETTVTAKDRYAKYATMNLQRAVIAKQAEIDGLKCKIALLNRLIDTKVQWQTNQETPNQIAVRLPEQ